MNGCTLLPGHRKLLVCESLSGRVWYQDMADFAMSISADRYLASHPEPDLP